MQRVFTLLSALLMAVFALVTRPAEAATPGLLTVDNDRPETVRVYVDDHYEGVVRARGDDTFRVPSGDREVRVKATDGRTLLRQVVRISPHRSTSVRLDPPQGQVKLVNDAGTRVELEVDGRPFGTLAAGELRTLTLEVGRHDVVASYQQFGRERTLRRAVFDLREGERELVELDPATSTLVRVVNELGRDLTVLVDGRERERLAVRESALVDLPLGRVRVEFLAQGRVVDAQVVEARPYEERTIVAEPHTGAVSIVNDLPITVLVQGPAMASRALRPGESVLVDDIEEGRVRFEATRTTGERIGSFSVEIRAGRTARVEVPEPQLGLVRLTNEDREGADVYVDGRRVARVAGFETERIEVQPGRRSIEVRDSRGRTIYRRSVIVDVFDEVAVEFGEDDHERTSSRHERHDHHERPDHDDSGVYVNISW